VNYIDTIAPSYNISLSQSWVESWGDHDRRKGRFTYTMWLHFLGGKSIRVTYHPTDMNGISSPTLIYTFSLPKMVSNCNHDQNFDIGQAIEEANRLLNGHNKLPSVRIEEGILRRIDPVYQYQVGNYAQDYVESLSKAHYPHRITKPYHFQGVAFPSGDETTKFYEKQKECKHPEAFGLLRHEKSIRGADYIGEKCGKRNPTILDIDKAFIKQGLEKDLERLRLDGSLICDREAAVESLQEYYGRTISEKLMGFWLLRQGYSRDQLVSICGYNIRTINRKESMIQEAGVAITANEKVSLPPLCIDM
jgi:hypothetical protein